MTSGSLGKVLGRAILGPKRRNVTFAALRFKAASADQKKKEENQIVFRQEEEFKQLPVLKVNWERWKRSYRHLQKYLDVYKAAFTFSPENHDGRLREGKEDHIMYYFRTPEDLNYWYIMTDEDVEGHSWGELVQGQNEMTMLFRGYLSQQPPAWFVNEKPHPEIDRYFTGTAFVETKPFYTFYDRKEYASLMGGFNCIKLRYRGDGRRYWFETVCDFESDLRLAFRYPLFTRGGPLWEEIEIPYAKLHCRREGSGTPVLQQCSLNPNFIENFRFLLNDGIEGPFQFELDYIALTHSTKYPEVTACPTNEFVDVHDPWEPINSGSGS